MCRPPRPPRVRQLSRGGRRKTDVLDAAASVAALHGDAVPVTPEGPATVLAMLDERRTNLTVQRTRTVNQPHAVLRDLLPGGASTDLTAEQASALLARIRPASTVEHARKDLARELVADIRALDGRPRDNRERIAQAVCDTQTSLTTLVGVGPIVAGRLLGRTGTVARFPTAAAFASYTGTAPIEIASADKTRHRLSRYGDRKLNNALHTIALTQIRLPTSEGRRYFERKIGEGKTHSEAMRCLKRRLATRVWNMMTADEQRHERAAGPRGHSGATLISSAAGSTPQANSSDQSPPGPTTTHPTEETKSRG